MSESNTFTEEYSEDERSKMLSCVQSMKSSIDSLKTKKLKELKELDELEQIRADLESILEKNDKTNATEKKAIRREYNHPVTALNNRKLRYDLLLNEAPLSHRRLDRKYTVAELRDSTYIGVFARQTLSAEVKKVLQRVYPTSKWCLTTNFRLGNELTWKCTSKNCNYRLQLKTKQISSPFLIFKSDSLQHEEH